MSDEKPLIDRLREIHARLNDGRKPVPYDLHRAVKREGDGTGWNYEAIDLGISTIADIILALEELETLKRPAGDFVDDWNRMVLVVSGLAAKYDFPAPEMICHPQWLMHMRKVSLAHIAPVIIYGGVKIRFGRFEQADVFKTLP